MLAERWWWVGRSVVSESCDPMDYIARQAPLSMGFCRQEYWGGLPSPPPGDLPYPGIEPGSLALQADSLLTATSNCYESCTRVRGQRAEVGCSFRQVVIEGPPDDLKEVRLMRNRCRGPVVGV